jgi:hypothetical protein
MKFRHVVVAAFLALVLSVAFVTSHPSNTTVHEWGTFTSVSGPSGAAMNWLPLSGAPDLPSFVEHLRSASLKAGLRGILRMETPVLYFYSPQESTVSVQVSFSKGLITEWYPHASVPALNPRRDLALTQKQTEGVITWNSVQIEPGTGGDFPGDSSGDRYYAARQTAAAPVSVSAPGGTQHERFLFYRGVSDVLPPLTAGIASDGTILLQNHFPAPIRNAILLERRGSKIGFRVLGAINDQASFASPALEGSLEALYSDLEGLLVAQGLYADEAHAMLETWKDSWFGEGSRVLYFVQRGFVDSALPLTITPAPQQITRVFVGRLELITPATQKSVESAFDRNDQAMLAKYNRFLEPILHSMLDQASDQPTRERLTAYLNSAYSTLYSQSQR